MYCWVLDLIIYIYHMLILVFPDPTATQQSLNNSSRTSSTAAAAATASHNSSSVPGAGTGAAAGISGQPPPSMNELFSQILGAAGGTSQTGPFPPEVAPMINSIFQAAVSRLIVVDHSEMVGHRCVSCNIV